MENIEENENLNLQLLNFRATVLEVSSVEQREADVISQLERASLLLDSFFSQYTGTKGSAEESSKFSSLVMEWIVSIITSLFKKVKVLKVSEEFWGLKNSPDLALLRDGKVWKVFLKTIEHQEKVHNGNIAKRFNQSQSLSLLKGLMLSMAFNSSTELGSEIIKCFHSMVGTTETAQQDSDEQSLCLSLTFEACSDFVTDALLLFKSECSSSNLGQTKAGASKNCWKDFVNIALGLQSAMQRQHTNQKKVFKNMSSKQLVPLLCFTGSVNEKKAQASSIPALEVLSGALFHEEHLEGYQSFLSVQREMWKIANTEELSIEQQNDVAEPSLKKRKKVKEGKGTKQLGYQHQLLLEVHKVLGEYKEENGDVVCFMMGLYQLMELFVQEARLFMKREEKMKRMDEDLKKRRRFQRHWSECQLQFWIELFECFLQFDERMCSIERYSDVVPDKVLFPMLDALHNQRIYLATEDDAARTGLRRLRALVARVLAAGEARAAAAGAAGGVGAVLRCLGRTFSTDPRLTEGALLPRAVGLAAVIADRDAGAVFLERTIQTYSHLRQLDHFISAVKSAAVKHPAEVLSLIEVFSVEQSLARAFLLSPQGQLEALWGALEEGIEIEFCSEDSPLFRRPDSDRGVVGVAWMQLFNLFIKSLAITSDNVAVADALRTSTFKKVVESNLKALMKGMESVQAGCIPYQRTFIEFYSWLIDLHSKCDFWEEVMVNWTREKASSSDSSFKNIVKLLESYKAGAAGGNVAADAQTATRQQIVGSSASLRRPLLQLAATSLTHLQGRETDSSDRGENALATVLADWVAQLCDSEDQEGCSTWSFLAPHLLVWTEYASREAMRNFMKWLLPDCALSLASRQTSEISTSIKIFEEASFYDIGKLGELAFPVAFGILSLETFGVFNCNNGTTGFRKKTQRFCVRVGCPEEELSETDLQELQRASKDPQDCLDKLTSMLTLLNSLPREYLACNNEEIKARTAQLCSLEEALLEEIDLVYTKHQFHDAEATRKEIFFSSHFSSKLIHTCSLLRALVQRFSSCLSPQNYMEIEYLYSFASLTMPFKAHSLAASAKNVVAWDSIICCTVQMEQKVCSFIAQAQNAGGFDFWHAKKINLGQIEDMEEAFNLKGSYDMLFRKASVELAMLNGFLQSIAYIYATGESAFDDSANDCISQAFQHALQLTWRLGRRSPAGAGAAPRGAAGASEEEFWVQWFNNVKAVVMKGLLGLFGPSEAMLQACLACIESFCCVQDERVFEEMAALFLDPGVAGRRVDDARFQAAFCLLLQHCPGEGPLRRLAADVLGRLSSSGGGGGGRGAAAAGGKDGFLVPMKYLKLMMSMKKGGALNRATSHALVDIMMAIESWMGVATQRCQDGEEGDLTSLALGLETAALAMSRRRYEGVRARGAALALGALRPALARLARAPRPGEELFAQECLSSILKYLSFMLHNYPKHLYSCLPCLLIVTRELLEAYMRRKSHNGPPPAAAAAGGGGAPPDRVPAALARLFEQMLAHKDVFKRYLPYLLSDYMLLTQKYDIKDFDTKRLLNKAAYFLVDACTEYELQQIHSLLDATGKSLFATFNTGYQSQHKYRGNG